jgi:pimeloyl-ACP methyl ester carboxylesterase
MTDYPRSGSQADGLLSPGAHAIELLGVRQAYVVAGEGPVCVVHSGGPGIGWSYLRMPALEQHFTMLYLEPIGTGNSGRLTSHPVGYSVARYSELLAALFDALDLRDALLLGHSHGGFVAQYYALQQPERLRGVVIYASAAVTGGAFIASAGQNVTAFAARHEGDAVAEDVLAAWQGLGSMQSDADYLHVLQRLLPVYFADFRRPDLHFEAIRNAITATLLIGDGAPFDVTQDLPGLRVPALVLAGEEDFICGPAHNEIIASLAPDARFLRFQDSGHFIHLEQADAFNAAVLGFGLGIGAGRGA